MSMISRKLIDIQFTGYQPMFTGIRVAGLTGYYEDVEELKEHVRTTYFKNEPQDEEKWIIREATTDES